MIDKDLIERNLFKSKTVFTIKNKQIEVNNKIIEKLVEVLKNNGVELDALTIINVECRTAPTVYLNGYYEEFNEGKSIEDITEEIYGMFRKNYGRININAEDFADFDKVRGQIAYKVINARKNGRLLKKIPHVKQLDLAIVFYCILKCNKYENATTLIYNQHLEMWE